MQVLWPWFLVAQTILVPTLAPGTEVRIVSPDLLEVYAFGTVDNGRLALEGSELVPGLEIRLLILPPDAGAAERAAAAVASDAVGTPAPVGRVSQGDVLVIGSDGEGASLRALLADQGIVLRYPGEPDR